jgi:hypothetical protein
MTQSNMKTQTLVFLAVFVGLVAYHMGTTATPVTLQAASLQTGDRCFRCQRLIVDRSIAVEGIGRDGVRKFKTIACMLKYLRDSNDQLDILVTDVASNRFTQARFANFVRTTIDDSTGEVDYKAFRTAADARQSAVASGTTLLDWEAVQAAERANPLIR